MDLEIKLLNPDNFMLMLIQKSGKTHQTYFLPISIAVKNMCACVCSLLRFSSHAVLCYRQRRTRRKIPPGVQLRRTFLKTASGCRAGAVLLSLPAQNQ